MIKKARVAGGLLDAELIEAVGRGDQRGERFFYEHLHDVVDQTLYRVFRRREHDHDDLMQAAFEQIVSTLRRRSYAGACSLRTWAANVTCRVGFTALRARRRERTLVDPNAELDLSAIPGPAAAEDAASATIELGRVRRHLSAMKRTRAETVLLHDVLGHQLAEVALIMGVSEAAAQSRLTRGRRELYRRLDAEVRREPRCVPSLRGAARRTALHSRGTAEPPCSCEKSSR